MWAFHDETSLCVSADGFKAGWSSISEQKDTSPTRLDKQIACPVAVSGKLVPVSDAATPNSAPQVSLIGQVPLNGKFHAD